MCNKKTSGNILYRCELCGEIHEVAHVPNIISALNVVVLENDAITSLDRETLHFCEDGKVGVSKIVGAKFDE